MESWKETAQLEASCLAVGGCTEASRTTQTGEKSHYEEMSQREPWRRPWIARCHGVSRGSGFSSEV